MHFYHERYLDNFERWLLYGSIRDSLTKCFNGQVCVYWKIFFMNRKISMLVYDLLLLKKIIKESVQINTNILSIHFFELQFILHLQTEAITAALFFRKGSPYYDLIKSWLRHDWPIMVATSHAFPWVILTVALCKVYAISTWRSGNSRSLRYCWKPHHLYLEGWDQNPCPFVLKSVFILMYNMTLMPRWLSGKEPACQCRRCRTCGFNTWVEKMPWRRKWQPTPIFLLRESHA